MRNKTANEILKILRYLISPDKEIVNLGIHLFKTCYLVTQLNKYQKFKVRCDWPGFSSDKPKHFIIERRCRAETEFTKGQFIKMLESQKIPEYTKAAYILNFVKRISETPGKNRNKNYNLSNAISFNKLSEDIVGRLEKHSSRKVQHIYYEPDIKQRIRLNKLEALSDDFHDLGIKSDTRCSRNVYEYIESYKSYLKNRYKNKLQVSILRNKLKKLRFPIDDINLFLRKFYSISSDGLLY